LQQLLESLTNWMVEGGLDDCLVKQPKPLPDLKIMFADPDEPVSFVAPKGATVDPDAIILLGRIQEHARATGKTFGEAADDIERGW